MQDARDAEGWEPPKKDRFRRETATIAFTEASPPASRLSRAAPIFLGLIAGASLATLAYVMGVFPS